MEEPRAQDTRVEARSSDVWREFLGRAPLFTQADFEELCRRHPELSESLRRLKERAASARLEGEKLVGERLRRLAEPVQRGARFVREDVIAQGGMGVIRRVRDVELNRELALKETKLALDQQPPLAAARFFEEAQVTAQLDHPGIVPIHEVGLDAAGRLYFAMKLVQGRDLKAILDLAGDESEGWTRTRVLGVLLKVCEAMAYAHAKGVIHRDLKPGNVMVGHYGEVYVMDWGLARAMGRPDMHDIRVQIEHSVRTERREAREEAPDSPLVTMDGVVVGTPAYMPPEQARGEVQLLSRRSDVYSIGAMLYHLLAGHAPYILPGMNVSARHVLWRVAEGPPRPVNEFDRELPAELVAICEKAMARDPEKRYPDTLALGEDLRAYLEGRVVHALETGAIAELRKWVGRNKSLATAIAAAILALAGGFATSASFYVDAAESAAAEKRKADEVLRLSTMTILAELESEADELWPALPGNVARYEDWLRRAGALVADRPRFEARLAEMSRPVDAAPREAASVPPPDVPELVAARREREYVRRLQAALLAGEGLAELGAEDAAALLAELPATSAALELRAWPLVAPDRAHFGDEAAGLVLARKALELARGRPASERAVLRMSHAWALLANGRLDEAMAEAQDARSEAGTERAGELERELTELQSAVDLAVGEEGEELERRRLADLDERIAKLEARAARLPEAPAHTFDSPEDHWWHDQLERLVVGLKHLSDPQVGLLSSGISPRHGWGITRRLEFARTIEERSVTGAQAAASWSEAIASIHDRSRCPMYAGLALEPQVGLLPLGRDPSSGLWEFADLQTGAPPVRGADGRLVLEEETGLVLVLLPGGSFPMGAQGSDRAQPNFDAEAMAKEAPVKEVRLAPFFLAKYEMTQGQWLRLGGDNPSADTPETYKHLWNAAGLPGTLLHPVEHVSHVECEQRLARIGMSLPTEAQWEYGARAGTQTPWWTGDAPESLAGAANLFDRYAREHDGEEWEGEYEAWLDDGHTSHAPVGSFRPNAFGLHDTLGNIMEWCQDWYLGYGLSPRKGDGLRELSPPPGTRIVRGGGLGDPARKARSSWRFFLPPETSGGDHVGLRPARSIASRRTLSIR